MSRPTHKKSSVSEIRARFDEDVERFSDLSRGQSATVDATLAMDLITQAAYASTSPIRRVLDVGCGAGNNTLKLAELVSSFESYLVDISRPMLDRAAERVGASMTKVPQTLAGDIRAVSLPAEHFDVILAAAVLHHLRDDEDWEGVFSKLYTITAPGGSIWITDLVSHETAAVDGLMWSRYARYLEGIGGAEYRKRVFEYIDKEDSPRPVTYQLDLLASVGFSRVELLHKNSCFAAFGAVKE
jgi:tRNA (cmo5U34)-methyltransferase